MCICPNGEFLYQNGSQVVIQGRATGGASLPWSRCSAICVTTRGWIGSRCAAKTKVDAQWKLFCLVHNIEKLAHQGYAQ